MLPLVRRGNALSPMTDSLTGWLFVLAIMFIWTLLVGALWWLDSRRR